MAQLASVRAEIKAWERNFKSKEGREATVDDIKQQPEIAQKYKLYKKLSKAAANSQPNASAQATSSQSSEPPTTPPRSRNPPPSLFASAKRVAESTAPLSSFNPFSPQKAKGKERERPPPRTVKTFPNPFASPAKQKPGVQKSCYQSPQRTITSDTNLNHGPPSAPAPTTAISRARKRLRGDPVSPSPSKEKRRRTGFETTLPLPPLKFAISRRDTEPEEEEQTMEQDLSFVDDSPMKLPSTGRSFTLLFDETSIPSADIFGLNTSSAGTREDVDLFGPKRPQGNTIDLPRKGKMMSLKSVSGKIFPAFNLKQGNLSKVLSNKGEGSSHSSSREQSMAPPESITSSSILPSQDSEGNQSHQRRSKSPLLPPSPPPSSVPLKGAPNKGKRKAHSGSLNGRKKVKISEGEETDDESTSDSPDLKSKVKIVTRPRNIEVGSDDGLGPEFDPILDYTHHPQPHETLSASATAEDQSEPDIDLPNKFRNVLALDLADGKSREREEAKVVTSLLYGRRVSHYDPKKGEIWDVGEDEKDSDEGGKQGADDEEWEGEPVPWEVAEL